jgi:hypothetical protein
MEDMDTEEWSGRIAQPSPDAPRIRPREQYSACHPDLPADAPQRRRNIDAGRAPPFTDHDSTLDDFG